MSTIVLSAGDTHQHPDETARSFLENVNVQRLLDFLDHLPEHFTPVVQTDADGAWAYYIVNSQVDDDLRSKVLVIEQGFADTLRKLASAFYARPEPAGNAT